VGDSKEDCAPIERLFKTKLRIADTNITNGQLLIIGGSGNTVNTIKNMLYTNQMYAYSNFD